MAFLDRVLRIAEVERVELQQRVVVVVGDREHRLEDSLEPDVLPAVREGILLQKRLVRALLHLNEVRNLNDRRDLAEVLTAAAPALDHSCHMFSRRTMTSNSVFSSIVAPAPAGAPAAPGMAATAIGAAADTPHFSWSSLESWAASSSVSLLSCSAICSTVDIDQSPLITRRRSCRAVAGRTRAPAAAP